MSGKPVSTRLNESSHEAIEELGKDEGISGSKALAMAANCGLREKGYLDSSTSRVDPILSELGRFAGYSASVLLGVHVASTAELVEYAVVLFAIALVAIATQRVSHHFDGVLERDVA